MRKDEIIKMSLEDIYSALRMYAGVDREKNVAIHFGTKRFCSVTDKPLDENEDVDPRHMYIRTIVTGATIG